MVNIDVKSLKRVEISAGFSVNDLLVSVTFTELFRNVSCLVIELEQGSEVFTVKYTARTNRIEIFRVTVT